MNQVFPSPNRLLAAAHIDIAHDVANFVNPFMTLGQKHTCNWMTRCTVVIQIKHIIYSSARNSILGFMGGSNLAQAATN